jgi:hypothetical protein
VLIVAIAVLLFVFVWVISLYLQKGVVNLPSSDINPDNERHGPQPKDDRSHSQSNIRKDPLSTAGQPNEKPGSRANPNARVAELLVQGKDLESSIYLGCTS